MLVKRNGILFEEKDESLMDRVNQVGTTTPTSPAGAAAIGANPDVAKMVGSGAQRQNALRQAVAPKEQTLAGQERLAGPAQVTPADQQAQVKAEQLRQLGSLRNRVQSVMEQRIASTVPQQTGIVGFDDNRIDQALGLNPNLRAADPAKQQQFDTIKTNLSQFMSAPDQATKMQNLVALSNAGMKKSDIYALTGMTETGAQATGDAIAAAMSDELTLGELDVTQLGYESPEQLAEVLGVSGEQLNAMTVPQIQEQYQKVQQEQYSQVQNMSAELQGLPSNSARATQIKSQLRAMGDVGRFGMEKDVADSLGELEKAGTIKIGANEYGINEILDDDRFSELVQDYMAATTPEAKEAILPAASFGNLREWIDNNAKAVAVAINDAKGTIVDFRKVNDEWEGLSATTGLSEDLLSTLGGNEYDPNKMVTASDLEQFKNNLSTTGIGQLALSDNKQAKVIVGEIATLSPEQRTELGIDSWSSEQIQKSHEVMSKINSDPVVSAMFPDLVNFDNKFATPQMIADYESKLGVINTISALPPTEEASIMNSKETVDAISSGKIPTEIVTKENAIPLSDPDIVELYNNNDAPTQEELDNYELYKPQYDVAKRTEDNVKKIYNDQIAAGTPEYDAMVDGMLDKLYGDGDWINDIKGAVSQLNGPVSANYPGAKELQDKYKKLLDAKYIAESSDVDLRAMLRGETPNQTPDKSLLVQKDQIQLQLDEWSKLKKWTKTVEDGVGNKYDIIPVDKIMNDPQIEEAFYGPNAKYDPLKFGAPSATEYAYRKAEKIFNKDMQLNLYDDLKSLRGDKFRMTDDNISTIRDSIGLLQSKVNDYQKLLNAPGLSSFQKKEYKAVLNKYKQEKERAENTYKSHEKWLKKSKELGVKLAQAKANRKKMAWYTFKINQQYEKDLEAWKASPIAQKTRPKPIKPNWEDDNYYQKVADELGYGNVRIDSLYYGVDLPKQYKENTSKYYEWWK